MNRSVSDREVGPGVPRVETVGGDLQGRQKDPRQCEDMPRGPGSSGTPVQHPLVGKTRNSYS